MKIQPYVEKLNSSTEYLKFKEKHKDAFLIAGFFILDLESGNNIHQIDYFLPSEGKIAAFTLDKKVVLQVLDAMNKKVPEALDMKTTLDLDALQGVIQDEMKNRSMSEDIKKIIAILQNVGGKKVWNINCVLSGMEILKAHIEDSSKTVLSMEKISAMDVIKKMPPQALKALQEKGKLAQGTPSQQPQGKVKDMSPENKDLNLKK
jgi:hypothetical protein